MKTYKHNLNRCGENIKRDKTPPGVNVSLRLSMDLVVSLTYMYSPQDYPFWLHHNMYIVIVQNWLWEGFYLCTCIHTNVYFWMKYQKFILILYIDMHVNVSLDKKPWLNCNWIPQELAVFSHYFMYICIQ